MDRVDGDPRYSTLPQTYDGSGLPEVYHPEVQSPQSPNIQHQYSYYSESPYIDTPKAEAVTAVAAVPTPLPWWRRYWIFLLVAAIVVAGGLGGGLGGGLAARNNSKDEWKAGSEYWPKSTSTSPSPAETSSSAAQSSSSLASTATTTTAPTSTASPAASIYLGTVNITGVEWQIGFLPDQPCRFTTIIPTKDGIPCEHPFVLCDSVTYTWHGCGSDTWVTWGNNTELGNCGLSPKIWTCGDRTVVGTWLCS